jgi:hypothetical protein
MRLNLTVLIGLLLCVVVMGIMGVLSRTVASREGWSPNDVYSGIVGSAYSIGSCSNASSRSNTLTLPAVSMRGGSMFRRRSAFSYAPAYSAPTSLIASSPYRLGASASNSVASPIYTTSSAEFRSFGGGNNISGVSVLGGQVKSSNSSVANASGLNVSMPSISMYAYNSNRSSASDIMSSMSGDIAMASTQAYAGIGNTTKGIAGRKNASSMGGNLDNWVQDIIGNDGWVWTDGTIDYFDKAKLYQMYQEAIANGDLPEGITWEEFLSWFGDQSDRYAFPIPSGVWFMCFLALGYGLYIAYRRKQKVVNS